MRTPELTIDDVVGAIVSKMDMNRSQALTAVAKFIERQSAPSYGQSGKKPGFSVSTYSCDLSPIGMCIEDDSDSEGCCVFCGDPSERK